MILLKKSLIVMIAATVCMSLYHLLVPDNRPLYSADADSSAIPNQERTLPGEQFIRSRMINEDGTLRTYLKPNETTESNVAIGHDALSESMGLWLLYSVEKGDAELFKQNAKVVQQSFMKPDGWLYWKIGKQAEPVSTNALVDDLRIAYAFYLAGDKWQMPEFKETADTITESLLKRQVVNGSLTDFYDYDKKWASNVITMPYLDMFALVYLYEHSKISEELFQSTASFVKEIPLENGFYPFSYNVNKKTYKFNEEVNLLDQLFVEYSRVKLGVTTTATWTFIKDSFYSNHALYGRYSSSTKNAIVEYESPAVYGLAIICAIAHNDTEFAKDLYYRMIRYQTLNPSSEYYGGYINYAQLDTHIFDNLLPLLAERKLYNAKVLQ